ncbi:hypothetical protein, partial [Rummeliibacillus sp. SL167]|uniref:hypothetical protein n=1 Tax=Rummeliibacillus sp. SL167 TaxID=2579792 RepID=UPI001C9723C1
AFEKLCIFKTIYIDLRCGLLESSKMQAFSSCGVIRGRKFNVPREKRIDETPQRKRLRNGIVVRHVLWQRFRDQHPVALSVRPHESCKPSLQSTNSPIFMD